MLGDEAIGRTPATTSADRDRGWIVRRGLLLADAVGLTAAFAVTAVVFGDGTGSHNHLALAAEYLLFIATLPAWLLGAKLHELYDRDEERTDHSTFNDFLGVLHVVTLGVWILYAAALGTGLADPELPKALLFWALAVLFVTSGRACARAVCRRHPAYQQNTLILGTDDVGQLIARKLLQHPEYGVRLVGLADDGIRDLRPEVRGQRIVCEIDDVPEIVAKRRVQRVVVAFPNDPDGRLGDLVTRLKAMDIQIDIVPRLLEVVGPNVEMHSVEGLPLVGLPTPKLLPFSRTIKRLVD